MIWDLDLMLSRTLCDIVENQRKVKLKNSLTLTAKISLWLRSAVLSSSGRIM